MSPTAEALATATAPPSLRQDSKEAWRRWRWPVCVLAVIVLAGAVIALSVPAGNDGRRLSPGNAAPEGSRALAQVLARQGVDVVRADRTDEATGATTSGSTLVVTDTMLLAPEQLDRLARDDASRLVLIEPDEVTLSVLAPQLRAAGYSNHTDREYADCSVGAAVTAGDIRGGGHLYARSGGATEGGVAVCYPQSDSDDTSGVDSSTERGSYVVTAANGRQVVVIGQSDLLTNEHLAENGNAALALNTFGAQSSLVWYTPDPLEVVGADQRPTPADLLPRWVLWSLVQLAVVTLLAMAWRARRFGRLVGEPLPVVVRAAETQEGRARLYRQAGARGRAAATLRTTSLRRLATRVAAPGGTTPQQLVALVAAATGRNAFEVEQTLLGPAPASDGALVELADRLDALERAAGIHSTPTRPR